MSDSHHIVPKLKRAFRQLPHLPRALALVWEAARLWTLSWFVLLLVQGLLPVATVFLTRALVDRLASIFGSGAAWETARPLLILVALMAALLLI
ncbi:MAG: ABC transporter ATP-binding protein, partial [Acidobacteriota bacterium]|nr:ABC transporter ATP-binding protein [Acidobacteriota bacterium]